MISNNWRPTASLANLKIRADLLKKIRKFFDERQVLEVETPVLCNTSVTAPYLDSFEVPSSLSGNLEKNKCFYLQTSPEYAMKRLLAAESGPIYQMAKMFRKEEMGSLHNPEFTMLEWYRPGWDYHQLMDEVEALLQYVLTIPAANRLTYRDVFISHLNIDPFKVEIETLMNCANQHNIHYQGDEHDLQDKDLWLNLLMTHCIEPYLVKELPTFIYDYPASQAALAKIRTGDDCQVAERFEVYLNGMELANGFQELTHAKEQEQRFLADLAKREMIGLKQIPIDHYLLSALNEMPACSGVALGVDRLVMFAARAKHIKDVLSFTIENA